MVSLRFEKSYFTLRRLGSAHFGASRAWIALYVCIYIVYICILLHVCILIYRYMCLCILLGRLGFRIASRLMRKLQDVSQLLVFIFVSLGKRVVLLPQSLWLAGVEAWRVLKSQRLLSFRCS